MSAHLSLLFPLRFFDHCDQLPGAFHRTDTTTFTIFQVNAYHFGIFNPDARIRAKKPTQHAMGAFL
jgi:hypothetical protein